MTDEDIQTIANGKKAEYSDAVYDDMDVEAEQQQALHTQMDMNIGDGNYGGYGNGYDGGSNSNMMHDNIGLDETDSSSDDADGMNSQSSGGSGRGSGRTRRNRRSSERSKESSSSGRNSRQNTINNRRK
jgi:hypothetical protein